MRDDRGARIDTSLSGSSPAGAVPAEREGDIEATADRRKLLYSRSDCAEPSACLPRCPFFGWSYASRCRHWQPHWLLCCPAGSPRASSFDTRPDLYNSAAAWRCWRSADAGNLMTSSFDTRPALYNFPAACRFAPTPAMSRRRSRQRPGLRFLVCSQFPS